MYTKHNKTLFFQSSQLESIISLSIALIGVDDERAAESHSKFLIELFKCLQDDLLYLEEGQSVDTQLLERERLLFSFLKNQACQILKTYVQEILKVPRRSVADNFVDVLVETVASFITCQPEIQQWLAEALQTVPSNVFTEENKQVIVEMASDTSGFRRGRLAQEFDILAKRARSSAVRAK